MNDVCFVPLNVRLYIYSSEDPLMSWEGIEAHAKLVSDIGWQVGREVFSHTSHVSHMKKYARQYWGAIQATWDLQA